MFRNWSFTVSQHNFVCKSLPRQAGPLKPKELALLGTSTRSFPVFFAVNRARIQRTNPINHILSFFLTLTFLPRRKVSTPFQFPFQKFQNPPQKFETLISMPSDQCRPGLICMVFSALFPVQAHKKHSQRIQWEFSTYIMLFAASYNFKLNKSVPQLMCFLKFINPVHTTPIPSKEHPHFSPKEDHKMAAFSSPFLQLSKNMGGFGASDLNLLNCLKMMSFNSQIIQNLQASLTANSELLEKSHELVPLKKIQEKDSLNCDQLSESAQTVEGLQQSSDLLTTKLFGSHGYKYKLVLADQLADTLYKDRNFKLNVKLVNLSTGEVQNNGNLINICLSICDSNGEWIHQAKEGGAFLKGKLQADLYHGCGQFVKLSPRDVSRSFTDKRVNIVVYAKPSMLKYSGESSIQRIVDFKLIEPLVVKDVSIKAKKRQ